MEFEPPIAFLTPDTALEILAEEGDWLKVRAAGKEGYVGRKYVEIAAAPEKAAPQAGGGLAKPAAGPKLDMSQPASGGLTKPAGKPGSRPASEPKRHLRRPGEESD
jgi:hypothetical protein